MRCIQKYSLQENIYNLDKRVLRIQGASSKLAAASDFAKTVGLGKVGVEMPKFGGIQERDGNYQRLRFYFWK